MKIQTIVLLAVAVASSAPVIAIAGSGPSFTAVVGSDGTLTRGRGAVSASRLGKGVYEVDFNQDVTACGYTASVGLPGSSGVSTPGTVTVVGRSGNADALYIQTFTKRGKVLDLGFHVIVQC